MSAESATQAFAGFIVRLSLARHDVGQPQFVWPTGFARRLAGKRIHSDVPRGNEHA